MQNYRTVGNSVMQFKNIDRQGGWTFWSLTATLAVIMFFAYCIIQLIPVYSANGNIVNSMERSVKDRDLNRITRRDIIRKIDDQLYLDGSHELLNYKEDIAISRTRDKLVVQANYDRKVPLFFNLQILVEFTPEVECTLDGQCTTEENIF